MKHQLFVLLFSVGIVLASFDITEKEFWNPEGIKKQYGDDCKKVLFKCTEYHEITQPLHRLNRFDWTTIDSVRTASGKSIQPCKIRQGTYSFRSGSFGRLSVKDGKLKIRNTKRTTWTVTTQDSVLQYPNVLSVALSIDRQAYVGAQRSRIGTYYHRTLGWPPVDSDEVLSQNAHLTEWEYKAVLTKDVKQKFVPWCGRDGEVYLQILGGNQWLTSKFGGGIEYAETTKPRTSFELKRK